MPVAALPAIGMGVGAAGSAASSAGGKKAQDKANDLAGQQLALQQGQWKWAKQLGIPAFSQASDYWSSLLKGGAAAQQAVGPMASLVGQAGAGARSAIDTSLPRGGEANLAKAMTYNDTSNNISRLYAGVQPAAASALGQLSQTAFGLTPSANTGGAFANYMGQQQASQQAGQGFGNLMYKGAQQKKAKPSGATTGGA